MVGLWLLWLGWRFLLNLIDLRRVISCQDLISHPAQGAEIELSGGAEVGPHERWQLLQKQINI